MMKLQFSLLVALCLGLITDVYSQSSSVTPYGSNQRTGSYIRIRGIKMYYEEYGSGRPLLMIHGNGGDISAFKNNIPYFSAKYRVIVADSRAQGRTADSRDSLSFQMMADDYAELLDALHIPAAYVIGWSDGGITSLLLAIRHSRKVLRLAATGANLWPDSTALQPALWKSAYTTFQEGKNREWRTAKEKNDWKIFMLDWKEPHIALSALKGVTCPALIISGDHDLINLEHTLLIYRHIKNAQLWVIPGSGHATLIEHAREFNRKVDEFFQYSPAR